MSHVSDRRCVAGRNVRTVGRVMGQLQLRRPRRSDRRPRLATLVVALAALLTVGNLAAAAPLDLEEAERERAQAAERQEQLQAELTDLLSRIEELRVARERQSAEIDRLDDRLATERRVARRADREIAERYKGAYKAGTSSGSLMLLFGSDTADDVTERARLLSIMADSSRKEQEAAEGASARTAALSEQLDAARAELRERSDELAASQEEAKVKVAEAQAEVEQLDSDIAAERERRAEERRRRERERERERRAREAAQADDAAASPGGGGSSSGGGGSSSGGGSSGGGSAVSGGVACPVGTPRNYSDTWGAPRSGGRSHLGVDILAPHGTPIYAYESGTISRMDGNALGGISLYLEGASGTRHYYTHLSGYVSGLSVGQRVSAGQQIAMVGDTGNAAGIPHLHWEVFPGGGGNVNPYPYAARACG